MRPTFVLCHVAIGRYYLFIFFLEAHVAILNEGFSTSASEQSEGVEYILVVLAIHRHAKRGGSSYTEFKTGK